MVSSSASSFLGKIANLEKCNKNCNSSSRICSSKRDNRGNNWANTRGPFEDTPRDELPARLIIPSIGVDVAIFPAVIRNNRWETTSKGVSYLASSPIPGERGNSIIYGHNWSSILGNLSGSKPGQKVVIEWKGGRRKEFIITHTATVDPQQRYIIDSTPDTRLTIYTCIGFLDSKRFVVVAKPLSA